MKPWAIYSVVVVRQIGRGKTWLTLGYESQEFHYSFLGALAELKKCGIKDAVIMRETLDTVTVYQGY